MKEYGIISSKQTVALEKSLIKSTSQSHSFGQIKRIHFEIRLIKMDSFLVNGCDIFIKKFNHFLAMIHNNRASLRGKMFYARLIVYLTARNFMNHITDFNRS